MTVGGPGRFDMIKIKITNKMNALSFQRIAARVSSGTDQVMLDCMIKWARRYEAFTRRRFNQYARGAGDWKPLSPETIISRIAKERGGNFFNRHVKFSGTILKRDKNRVTLKEMRGKKTKQMTRTMSILIDTGLLQSSLSIGASGNLLMHMPKNVIRYGFAKVRHGSDKTTIQDIARYHNAGGNSGKNPPRRAILVQPDQATMRGMMIDETRAVNIIMRQEGAR